MTCIWIYLSRINNYENTWIYAFKLNDSSNFQLYLESIFYIISTVTTVGYGNTHSISTSERIFTMIVMLVSICLYSLALGKITESVSSNDALNNLINKKTKILNSIVNEFNIKPDIVAKIKKHMKKEMYYEHHKMIEFINIFPEKIKNEFAGLIFDTKISNFVIFRNKEENFIVYVSSLLYNQSFIESDFICKSGQIVKELYFIAVGTISYSLGVEYNSEEVIYFKKSNLFI